MLSIMGCNQNADIAADKINSNQPAKRYQKVLFIGQTKYSMIMNATDKTIGYFSATQNSLAKEHLTVLGASEKTENSLLKGETAENFSIVKFNGKIASELKNFANTENFDLNNQPLFGQNVSFTVGSASNSSNGAMRTPANDKGITMYVPELVKITSPNIATPEDLLPYCYYKNFVLGWNADPNNENGLVVLVEWTGTDMFGENYNVSVRNVDIVSDNGECILNEKLFDHIPQGALAKIFLLRGNIETLTTIFENGDNEYSNVVAASVAILPFIMVRNID
jgi:hypothetical protein